MICAAAHCNGHVHTAGAHGQHTYAAAGGGMRVRSDERFAGYAEALQMNLVAYAVARTGIVYAVLFGHCPDKAVIVGIFKAGLQGVVVYVGDRALGLYPRHAHRLKFKIGHGAGGVLRKRLVYFKAYVGPGGHIALNKVSFYDFLRNCKSHLPSP